MQYSINWKDVGRAIERGTDNTIEWFKKTPYRIKRTSEKIKRTSQSIRNTAKPTMDKYLLLAAANLGTVYGAAELINRTDYSDPTNALIMMGTGAALMAEYSFSKSKNSKAKYLASRINDDIDKSSIASWVKTGALVASIAYLGSEINPHFQEVRQDVLQKVKHSAITEESPTTENRPTIYEELGYKNVIEHNFSGTKLADKDTKIGRIQRTLRWEPIYRSVETAHGMPKDTLAGMIMQESYGDPVQPNAGNDGGLGVVHIQGPVAKKYGLKIYGNSEKSSDEEHGKQLKDMLESCNYDPACAEKYDDRAHILKVLDAAARIVTRGKEKHGTWDHGVEYYRAPGKVGRRLTYEYLKDVKNWRSGIQDIELQKEAARDFEKRNGYKFNKYISNWHEMSNNWGLRQYRARNNLKG